MSFANDGELAESLLTNFSRKAVFIETNHPAEIGTQLELSIRIGEPARTLTIVAEVVSHDLGPRLDARCGMGLQIAELDPGVEKQLDELYERLVK